MKKYILADNQELTCYALQSLLDNKVDGCEYWASRFEMSIDAYVEVSLSR